MYPNLKLRLWTTGIRQNRLAKMLTIDETTLSRIVNGFRQPSPEIRERIAAALDCDETWLFQTEERHRAGAAPAPAADLPSQAAQEGVKPPRVPPRVSEERPRMGPGVTRPGSFATPAAARATVSTDDGQSSGSVLSANDGGNGAAPRRASRRNRAPMSL
ncbi:MAG: helix-turn-helix transcriptional regulator [Bryobacterales bacterium]|nr:helix-turn-helix transcriptional regulator [Bryobacterales bacterium]